ncbi:putative photosystem I [Helianthus anomalus]
MSSISLGPCLLRTIVVVQFNFSSHISFQLENAVRYSDVWGSINDQGVVTNITGGNFAQSSITINGWLCDFLWAQEHFKRKLDFKLRSSFRIKILI